jgi:hypothetical protein
MVSTINAIDENIPAILYRKNFVDACNLSICKRAEQKGVTQPTKQMYNRA